MKCQVRIAKVTAIHGGLSGDSVNQSADDCCIENGDDEGIQCCDLCIHNQDGTDATIYKRCQTLFDDDVMNECQHFVFTQCPCVPAFDGQNAFVDNTASHHQSLAFSPEHDTNENGNGGGSVVNKS